MKLRAKSCNSSRSVLSSNRFSQRSLPLVPDSRNTCLAARPFFLSRQSCKGELLKLAGSLLLVYGRDVPELAAGVPVMLGWCDSALAENDKNKQVRTGAEKLNYKR